jgi:magnesium chelatase family protein
MLARRVPSILPNLTFEEALEITKIYSIAGELKEDLMAQRPFRSPHYTVSTSSMIGGGRIPKPGEISLAHYGVLFLDELPEFNRGTLEVLRGPLEDRKVTISRVATTVTYPSNFMLIASMNPCECGYYGSDLKKCNCNTKSIRRYVGKVSGPMLDRIDLHIEVKPVEYEKLAIQNKAEHSKTIKERVDKARQIQLERYSSLGIICNAELDSGLLDEFCKLDKKSFDIMGKAFQKFRIKC